MKTNFILTLGVSSAIVLTGCSKNMEVNNAVEDISGKSKGISSASCLSTSFTTTTTSGEPVNTSFEKSIDPVTGMVNRIKTGVHDGGAINETVYFDVRYAENRVIFLKDGSSTDTVLTAYLNNKGAVENVLPGNAPHASFLPTSFTYKGVKVSGMKISFSGNTTKASFTYDGYGNLIRIQEEAVNGVIPGSISYGYNTAITAAGQAYHDDALGFTYNTYSLVHSMNLVPGTMPTNLRTRTTVYWQDYMAYDAFISDHKIDGRGNLTSYLAGAQDPSGSRLKHSISWNCGGNPNALQ